VNIYIAVCDQPRSASTVIGAFSTEEKARAAGQEEEDEDAAVSGAPTAPLPWRQGMTQAGPLADGTIYDIILTDLDRRAGT
jgi:hypothetical protein